MIDPRVSPSACNAVTEHINKPIPPILWHYTSFSALQGIVTSKKIWATEYRFLNDREEYVHAKDLALELVEEEPELVEGGLAARDTLRDAVNRAFDTGPLRQDRHRIFVASFSEVADQLSQWRGYAGASTGVSIGLGLNGIRQQPELSTTGTTVTFAPCLYARSEKRALLAAVFAHLRAGLQMIWPSIAATHKSYKQGSTTAVEESFLAEAGAAIGQLHEGLLLDLLRVAPLLKNESFSEEREWRLVRPVEAIFLPTNLPISFRAAANTLVPYIAYPLLMPNQEGPIACNDVILGPGSHPSAEIGVNMFLQSQQIPMPAKPSRIPYRPV